MFFCWPGTCVRMKGRGSRFFKIFQELSHILAYRNTLIKSREYFLSVGEAGHARPVHRQLFAASPARCSRSGPGGPVRPAVPGEPYQATRIRVIPEGKQEGIYGSVVLPVDL
jgi:hypothetical protein